jgi:hypothetical protein
MAQFDPFRDRLARDIRNGLSTALIKGLDQSKPDLVHAAAADFLARDLAPHYRDYIRERLCLYEAVFTDIGRTGETDIFPQALFLWDMGLFFEVHERLETIWLKATGDRRLALQGMIRAAGTYAKWESGEFDAARKMAAKAATALTAYRAALPQSVPNLDALITQLRELTTELPPISLRTPADPHKDTV